MALRYFDVPHTLKEVVEASGYKKEGGMYNRQVVATLRRLGLRTKVTRNSTWQQLIDANTPDTVIIISWMLEGYIGHLSVVDHVDEKHIYLAEPTTGKILKIERVRFLRLWMDYEAKDEVPMYPETRSNIQLRWMVAVSHRD